MPQGSYWAGTLSTRPAILPPFNASSATPTRPIPCSMPVSPTRNWGMSSMVDRVYSVEVLWIGCQEKTDSLRGRIWCDLKKQLVLVLRQVNHFGSFVVTGPCKTTSMPNSPSRRLCTNLREYLRSIL